MLKLMYLSMSLRLSMEFNPLKKNPRNMSNFFFFFILFSFFKHESNIPVIVCDFLIFKYSLASKDLSLHKKLIIFFPFCMPVFFNSKKILYGLWAVLC